MSRFDSGRLVQRCHLHLRHSRRLSPGFDLYCYRCLKSPRLTLILLRSDRHSDSHRLDFRHLDYYPHSLGHLTRRSAGSLALVLLLALLPAAAALPAALVIAPAAPAALAAAPAVDSAAAAGHFSYHPQSSP